MALTTRCLDCGVRTKGSRCAVCSPRHERAHGRGTQEWKRLRAARRHLDGYQCVICGSTQDLTVDLDERLHGRHRGATLADCRTLCRSCNSSLGANAVVRRA